MIPRKMPPAAAILGLETIPSRTQSLIRRGSTTESMVGEEKVQQTTEASNLMVANRLMMASRPVMASRLRTAIRARPELHHHPLREPMRQRNQRPRHQEM